MSEYMFEDSVVLVTGGAGDIGAETCLKFAQKGAKVAINYAPIDKDRKNAEELIAKIEAIGGEAKGYECDISDRGNVQKMVDDIVQVWGKIDAVVNNAMISILRNALDFTEEDFQKMSSVNIGGTFWVTQACLKHMEKQGYGSVLFISSNGVMNGGGGNPLYPACKGALEGLMNGLIYEYTKNKDYRNAKIRFNVLRPGPTNTKTQRERYTEEQWAKYQDKLPMRRATELGEIAEAIVFLSNNQLASGICGVTLNVDGARMYHLDAQ